MTTDKGIKNEKQLLKKDKKAGKNVPSGEFEPPDGGWGWMIVVAAGLSNLCTYPMAQSFGLIFRDRFLQLGINASQVTTIMNVNNAVTACIGLANGPLFRKYSYRQVAFGGGLVTAISVCCLSFATTFQTVLLFYSILYGSGMGIATSSCALALNTYFKKRRRIATGFSWTCTGLGPIIMPQIITILMPIYGVFGTVLLYGGFALNSVACALLLQPVEWHVKKKNEVVKCAEAESAQGKGKEEDEVLKNEKAISAENILRQERHGSLVDNRLSQRFGSQYLYYNDEEEGAAGIDVVASGTPMMSRANDGWSTRKNSSHVSLSSGNPVKREMSQSGSRRRSVSLSRPASVKALSTENSIRNLSSDADDFKRRVSYPSTNPASLEMLRESCESPKNGIAKKEARETENPEDEARRELLAKETPRTDQEMREIKHRPWYVRAARAIVVFFDLDLLRDPVYVNLMLGISLANFAELNFALLTPFILGEYGFEKPAVATIMSTLAGVDVVTRIMIPFIATQIGWQNRTYFLIGVGSMAAGRIILAHVRSYGILLGVAVLIGAGKALRTIFVALVIPTHVPLRRLPAASGLQLLVSGIVFLTLGPLVGWIRDFSGNYTVTLHCLNILTYLTIISWTLEVCYCNRKRKRDKALSPI